MELRLVREARPTFGERQRNAQRPFAPDPRASRGVQLFADPVQVLLALRVEVRRDAREAALDAVPIAEVRDVFDSVAMRPPNEGSALHTEVLLEHRIARVGKFRQVGGGLPAFARAYLSHLDQGNATAFGNQPLGSSQARN